jgi:hypothetical protein
VTWEDLSPVRLEKVGGADGGRRCDEGVASATSDKQAVPEGWSDHLDHHGRTRDWPASGVTRDP